MATLIFLRGLCGYVWGKHTHFTTPGGWLATKVTDKQVLLTELIAYREQYMTYPHENTGFVERVTLLLQLY